MVKQLFPVWKDAFAFLVQAASKKARIQFWLPSREADVLLPV